MSDDLIKISSSVLPDGTRVAGFRGSEAISRPYQFEILLLIGDSEDLDMADAIGAKAKLVIDRANDDLPPFVFSGIFASLELLHEFDGRSMVRAIMVPKLWQLGLSRHSRIFTKKKLPEILEAILNDNGLSGGDYELRLGSYEPEEHVCQYRESDLDFIARWMEREGIFYFFEHGDDGETLIICDNQSTNQDATGKPVRYYPQVGDDRSAGASFRAFTCKHATLPASVKLKDYDYNKPNLDVSGTAMVADNGTGEVSLYGERFFSPSGGARLAKLRAEELLARAVVFHANGTRFHLRSGYKFELDEHPRGSYNIEYLAVDVTHMGNQAVGQTGMREMLGLGGDDVYSVEVVAIPAATQFRAPSRTPWPRIYGYENGIVDGPANSEYAQIDEHGRYSVKFKFDETNLKNGKASTFVRMMQPHGGVAEGFHFPLRKNTEVIFSFLGGDPDRPVIFGVVPTAITPSPVINSNHTQNIIQTGSENYIVLEDKLGAQFINIYCPVSVTNFYMGVSRPIGPHSLTLPSGPQVPTEGKRPQALGPFNFDLRTDGAGQIHTGGHLNIDANGQLQIEAHALTTLYAHADWHLDINGDADEKLWSKLKRQVVNTVEINYDNTLLYNVKLAATENYKDTLTQTTTKKATYTYNLGKEVAVNGAIALEKYAVGHKVEIKGGEKVEIEGGHATMIKSGDWKVDVPTGNANITCIDGKLTTAGKWNEFVSGDHIKVTMNATSETLIGIKNENFIGGKLGITIGYSGEVFVGVKHELSASVNCSINLGIRSELAMVDTKQLMVNNMTVGMTLSAIATKIRAHGTRLSPAGFTIM